MAKDKKSFLLYADVKSTVDHLTNEQAGELFKHLLAYVNDAYPVTNNPIVKIAFEPIKQSLKRDLIRYEQIREKRSKAGQISAKKRSKNKQVSTSVESAQQTSTNPTVSVSVSDSVSVSTVVDDKKTIAKIKVIDPESFYPTSKLVEEYLKNEKLCEIITKNPKNKLKNKTELKNRLLEFEGILNEKGRLVETWNEFAKYFLNWNLKNKQMTKHIVPKEEFISNPYRQTS